MTLVVADTSALVSLGTLSGHEANPLDALLDGHDVLVPTQVVDELNDTVSYEDHSGRAAQAVLDRRSRLDVQSTPLDETFPLDDGENAAVTLANDLQAAQLLCDEFNRLALIHASLVDTRLVTTPTLLIAFVRNDVFSAEDAAGLLKEMSDARSWEGNNYVARATATLQRERQNG